MATFGGSGTEGVFSFQYDMSEFLFRLVIVRWYVFFGEAGE